MRALARMNGYVIVEAILFATAANKNVSSDVCALFLVPR